MDEVFCKKEEFAILKHIPTENNPSIGDPIDDNLVKFCKDLTSLKDWKHILARTKKSYDAVKEDAQKQGVSTTQLLALHMYRENYNTNRDLAILSYKIYKKEDHKKPKFVDPKRALHLSERLKLGRGRYTDLKILMKNFVTLPTYAEVSLLRRAYSPKLKPFFNQDNQVVGICSDMKESLQCHIQK